jgi:phage-related tail protein
MNRYPGIVMNRHEFERMKSRTNKLLAPLGRLRPDGLTEYQQTVRLAESETDQERRQKAIDKAIAMEPRLTRSVARAIAMRDAVKLQIENAIVQLHRA